MIFQREAPKEIARAEQVQHVRGDWNQVFADDDHALVDTGADLNDGQCTQNGTKIVVELKSRVYKQRNEACFLFMNFLFIKVYLSTFMPAACLLQVNQEKTMFISLTLPWLLNMKIQKLYVVML